MHACRCGEFSKLGEQELNFFHPKHCVNGGRCKAGTYCQAGSVKPEPCPRGQYCASDALEKPSGNCSAGYLCPEGQFYFEGIGSADGTLGVRVAVHEGKRSDARSKMLLEMAFAIMPCRLTKPQSIFCPLPRGALLFREGGHARGVPAGNLS